MLVAAAAGGRYSSQSDGGLTAVLDCEITPALKEEGYVRELVSKVQTMRKESGFEVTDHILLSLSGSGIVLSAAKKYEADIMADVLADGCCDGGEFVKEWDVNGEKVTIGLSLSRK